MLIIQIAIIISVTVVAAVTVVTVVLNSSSSNMISTDQADDPNSNGNVY